MISQNLQISTKQTMNLTLALRQSINILQMSSIELTEMLSQELENNPFLESDNDEEELEERYDNMVVKKSEDNFDAISLIEDEKSLIDDVMGQMGSVISDHRERIVAIHLMNLLQDSGYVEIDMCRICNDLKVSEEFILSVLSKLQTLEPTGIFARNLQECLTIQLKDKGEYDEVFKIILENLPMLAMHDVHKLAKLCDVTKDSLGEYIKKIKLLNPKPCAGFVTEKVVSRIPDVILTISESGDIKIRINDEIVPKCNINKSYYSEVRSHLLSQQDRDFVASNYLGASNIVRAINQRLKTIQEVAIAIADKQKDFFIKGVMYLKPLTLGEIASVCGMNESTISRATSNKYIQTPTGIYDMKFFFTSKVQSKNSAVEISSTKVKEIIKSIVESEDGSNIYSDDDIAENLARFNINIARRTVAKYREAMGIQASNMRKRIARSLAV